MKKTTAHSKSRRAVVLPKRFRAFDPETLPAEYRLKVLGDSMAPVVKNGDEVVGSKGQVCPGDLVIIFWKPGAFPPSSPSASLKELVIYSRPELDNDIAPCLQVRQTNPSKIVDVPLDKVAAVHRARPWSRAGGVRS